MSIPRRHGCISPEWKTTRRHRNFRVQTSAGRPSTRQRMYCDNDAASQENSRSSRSPGKKLARSLSSFTSCRFALCRIRFAQFRRNRTPWLQTGGSADTGITKPTLRRHEIRIREPEIPIGWGALIESNGDLILARKPAWHEAEPESQLRFLQRIAMAGTRALNRTLEITFEEVATARCRS